ncbi:hypothetical protein HBI70_185690 [Parastagonospora nodorum]|nr:hypothetical protein HBI70_185690 [Parastagonospora nodorum]
MASKFYAFIIHRSFKPIYTIQHSLCFHHSSRISDMTESTSKPSTIQPQPRCGGQQSQDPATNVSGSSDRVLRPVQASATQNSQVRSVSGNSNSAMARWLEEEKTEAPWTPETRH